MNTQSEAVLEHNLINQLTQMGYQSVSIKNEAHLHANLKTQLETHNNTTLTDKEFAQKAGAVRSKVQKCRDCPLSVLFFLFAHRAF